MPFTLALPDGYSQVAAIALGVIPFVAWMHGNIVGMTRKEAKVPYPLAYASAEQAKASPAAHKFNCAQRAHLNYLENMPQTMAFILFAGAFYPRATVYTSFAWLACRVIYAYGYIYSDQPNGKGRLWGSAMWLAQGGLWGMCLNAIYTQLS